MERVPIIVSICFLLAVGCAKERIERPVARVNGNDISLEDFRYHLAALPPQMQVLYAYEEGHREFLDSIIEQKLLYQEAIRQGLADDPVIRSRIDNYVEQTRVTIERNVEKLQEKLADLEESVEESLLAKEMLDRVLPGTVEISEEELREHYEKVKERVLKSNSAAEVPDLGVIRREMMQQLIKKKFVEGLRKDADLELYYERLAPDYN
jgi:hypothetical protein